MNRICAVLMAISFCERKNSGKSAATTKTEAASAIRRLVLLGFSDQGSMAHV